MIPLVLASGSKVRAGLLQAAGVQFTICPASVDEDAIKESLIAEGALPRDIADRLAELKAIRVSAANPDALVIGADQILVFHGEIVSKSADVQAAKTLLRRLNGQVHELLSAIVLVRDGIAIWRHLERVEMHMRPLGDDFLDRYITEEGSSILDSVGCYRLEGRGSQLFTKIAGDYFAVLGLPLLPLLDMLRRQGALET